MNPSAVTLTLGQGHWKVTQNIRPILFYQQPKYEVLMSKSSYFIFNVPKPQKT